MSEVSSQVLHVVARELTAELNEARNALEAFGERQDDVELLRRCGEHLHQVHGSLRVVEIYGAALLAEEMEQVVGYLIETFAEKRHTAEGLDALMRAMVQLPTYLERVLGGGRDMALVLLPLLNDLRAVRGSPLLSEGTLLLLNLTSDQQASPVPAPAGDLETSVAQWARKLRTRFQVGLLGWIKGERPEQNLEVLARTAECMEQAATTQPVFQLWWVVGAVLESLRAKGLDGSASVKRLLGQADRELRRLYQVGEAAYSESPPIELLNNLLFYVARATTSGPRVSAVRASFRLDELLPVDDQVAEARESLSAPSVRLMKTVAAAIKEDLARVKDALDIFVRKGATQIEELAAQLDMLKKIGDTLGVLGLGELRDRVQSETAGLQAIISQQAPLDENSLLRIAATLIGIEDGLDEQLVGLIVPVAGEPRTADADLGNDTEFRHVTEAVLRECIVNMARIKEAIALLVERPADTQPLDQIPQLIRGITAGLLMLGKSRAVEVTEAIADVLSGSVKAGSPRLPADRMDRLADAIVSVEYYMETLQAGRADPWYMLDNAEACLKVLRSPQPQSQVPVVPAPADYARTIAIEPRPAAAAAPQDPESTTVFDPVATTPAAVAAITPLRGEPSAIDLPPVLAPSEDKQDPEFLELFIEEAKDEIGKLGALFPRWDENPQDQEALVNLRRSFHTLKGSGRMVGALLIGEVAWIVESMLNRVINKTLARTPEMMALLRHAVSAIPQLVEQLETGREPEIDIARLIGQAKAIAGVQEPAPRAEPAPIALSAAVAADGPAVTTDPMPAPPAAVAAPMDPVLHDIFAKETAAHLATIRDFLAAAEHATPPHPVTEALHRSCHTLSGIAKTAGARQGIKIAEPLNHYIRKLYDGGLGLPVAGLTVLRDSVGAIENVVDHIGENTGFFATHAGIVARLTELERAADLELTARAEVAGANPTGFVPETLAQDSPAAVGNGQDLDFVLDAEPAADVAPEFPLSASERVAPVIDPSDTAVPPALGEDFAELDFDLGAEESLLADGSTPPQEDPQEAESPDAGEGAPVAEETFFAEDVTTAPLDEAGVAAALTEPGSAPFPDMPLSEPAAALAASADEREFEPEDEDFDADVAAIFTEEATELLEAADTALAGWSQDQGNESYIFEFKRALHTLKGGARMAGIRAMGDLSHEIESFMLAIESHAVRPDATVFATMQASLDELHRMREAVIQGRRVPPARELMYRIRSLGGAPLPEEPGSAMSAAPEPGVPTSAWAAMPVADAVAAPSPEPQFPEPATDDFAVADSGHEEPAAEIFVDGIADAAAEPVVPAMPSPVEAAPTVLPPGREPQAQERHEVARVDAELLDTLLNNAGEVSIFRSRLEQQVGSIEFNLAELGRTVTRLKDQLRKLELETEAQVLHRYQQETGGRTDFDPLELDRYSSIQQLSRALAESVSDVGSIEGLLENLTREGQNLLMQQARVVTELQSGLMRTRMVPFQRHVQRLSRLVRQVATDTGKQAELVVTGASGELDRQVLERMLPPFEHMLRNAVVHGIEMPDERRHAGKPELGTINVGLLREGAEIVIVIEDDGRGIDVQAVRERARARGLLQPGRVLTDEEALQLVLEPGFSTASSVTQHAGRGVGMDVVVTEIKKLGGALFTQSTPGQGTRFTVRLPFTLAISQALIVRVNDELYALPLPTVEGVSRVPRAEVLRHLTEAEPTFSYGGQTYRFQYLGSFIGAGPSVLPETDAPLPVILIRAGEHSTALVADELVGSREIVVKSVGPQISGIRGISGATILGDGRIVIILDMGALVRSEWRARSAVAQRPTEDRRTFVLVVDDSITVRRVTQRLLERNGMRVMTAKDGMDALSILQEHVPDIILLDIEMPRMDGYELAAQVRSDQRLASIPIVMITSRVGEKHRARAIELGVNDYLGKPYQESQLLDAIDPLVEAHRKGIQAVGSRL